MPNIVLSTVSVKQTTTILQVVRVENHSRQENEVDKISRLDVRTKNDQAGVLKLINLPKDLSPPLQQYLR